MAEKKPAFQIGFSLIERLQDMMESLNDTQKPTLNRLFNLALAATSLDLIRSHEKPDFVKDIVSISPDPIPGKQLKLEVDQLPLFQELLSEYGVLDEWNDAGKNKQDIWMNGVIQYGFQNTKGLHYKVFQSIIEDKKFNVDQFWLPIEYDRLTTYQSKYRGQRSFVRYVLEILTRVRMMSDEEFFEFSKEAMKFATGYTDLVEGQKRPKFQVIQGFENGLKDDVRNKAMKVGEKFEPFLYCVVSHQLELDGISA